MKLYKYYLIPFFRYCSDYFFQLFMNVNFIFGVYMFFTFVYTVFF